MHTGLVDDDAMSTNAPAAVAIDSLASDRTPRPSAITAIASTDASVDGPVQTWGEEEFEDDAGWFGDESFAFVGSLLVHLCVIVMLGLTPILNREDPEAIVIVSSPTETLDPIEIVDEVTYSEVMQEKVGAASTGDFAMAEASAEMFAEIAEIPSPVEIETDVQGDFIVNHLFSNPVAPLDKLKNQKGQVGQGVEGAAGAVDRLTFEILQALEDRPTLVVWLFDQSGSLHRQRKEIRSRFDKIYHELGIVEQSAGKGFKKQSLKDVPLLTSIIGFGQDVKLFTEEPIFQLDEIKSIVDAIPVDVSGTEKVFTAVELAADQYETYRKKRGSNGPLRNVLLVVVTDERGDDIDRLESSIKRCRELAMPVYVIGVPAPFGRKHTLVKYVDPDPTYDQSPQWAEVDQGPETIMSEAVQVGFSANFQDEPIIDSGFGPYGLTRMCFETGGIYFTVHPNRNVNRAVNRNEIEPFSADLKYFFDPVIMTRYQPDYVPPKEYLRKVKESPLRTALTNAAMQVAPVLDRPQVRFVKRDEANLVGDLTRAQQDAARLEPALSRLSAVLEPGMAVRDAESTPRWRAGYDLAFGRVLAQKVRTETYNAMLAKLKRGIVFTKPANNTWVLQPADEISVGSKWEREAALAKQLLQSVVSHHPGTPWALLASEELKTPIGWQWVEEFTDLAPQPAMDPGNNNNPAAPSDDQKRMIPNAPKRPIPKL